MNNELLIPFESFAVRGVQKDTEMKTKLNTSSFFYNIYLQTYKLVEQICNDNEKYEEKRKKHKCGDDSEQDLNNIQNIIAFTGRRGTGKTSAMLSILESLTLQKYSEDFQDEKYGFNSKSYTTFPYIDAAMMTQDEDLFEIVLAKMATSVKNRFGTSFDRNYKYYERQAAIDSVYEKINKVYDHYSQLMGFNSDSSKIGCNFMEMITNKHNVRNEFVDLVKEYTNLFGTEEKNDCYLIICIDDIDMSLPNHMSIMQCIHQYFMIPKVIVLVSFNFELLNATLQRDFYSKLQINGSDSKEHENHMHLTRSQTYDFLKKVIPPDMRITMPSWKKRDYIELFPSKIDFSSMLEENTSGTLTKEFYDIFPNLSGSLLAEKICSNDNNEKVKLTPKHLIMILLADRTKCFLDAGGYKIHFMQPYSLRSLNDLFYLFYNMENIYHLYQNRKENDYYSKRESNRKILLDYLNFKMLHEFEFDSEKMRFIDSMLASPIERRGRMVWNYYHTLLNQEENKNRIVSMYNKDFYEKETSRNRADDYSFGELFRCLFSATRLGVFSSDFVKFILASFSFTMPQFIEIERKTDVVEKSLEYKQWKRINPNSTYWYPRTRQAFCYSLIGYWCRDLFGGKDVGINVKISTMAEENILKDRLETLLKVFTLCSCSSNNLIRYKKNDAGDYTIHAKIDPTAFILNILRFERRVEILRFEGSGEKNTLYELLKNMFLIEKTATDAETKKLVTVPEQAFDINNIKSTITTLRKTLITSEKFPLFLLKHTDLTYNVIKRVIRDMLYSSDEVLDVKNDSFSNPEEQIYKFYKKLYIELQKQDQKYFGKSNIEADGFAAKFVLNPVVSLFYVVPKENNGDDQGELVREAENENFWIHLVAYDEEAKLNSTGKKENQKDTHTFEVLNPISVKISDRIEVIKSESGEQNPKKSKPTEDPSSGENGSNITAHSEEVSTDTPLLTGVDPQPKTGDEIK